VETGPWGVAVWSVLETSRGVPSFALPLQDPRPAIRLPNPTLSRSCLTQSGADAVLKFITMQGRNIRSSGMQLAGCDLAGAVGDFSYCFSSTGMHHEPDSRDKTCKAQNTAVGLLHQQPFFERLRCNFATG